MTKKKRILFLLLVPVLLLFGLWAWFSRPQTAERLFPSFRWESVTEIGGSFELYEAENADGSLKHLRGSIGVKIDAADQASQELLALLQQAQYRRSLSSLFPSRTRNSGPIQAGDLIARANLFGDGFRLTVEFWFDELTLSYYSDADNVEYRCTTRNREAMAAQVYAFLQSHATEQAYDLS